MKCLNAKQLAAIETQLRSAWPCPAYTMIRIAGYFDISDLDGLLESDINNDAMWEQRYTFLSLVLAAEGEL